MTTVTDTARKLCSSCRDGIPASCAHWFFDHNVVNDPPPHTQKAIIDMAWTIVKDHKEMRKGGHERAYRWAREYLGLEDHDEVVAVRHTADTEQDPTPATHTRPSMDRYLKGHVHGWATKDGTWTCIQDWRAIGFAPETGCGATWPTKP